MTTTPDSPKPGTESSPLQELEDDILELEIASGHRVRAIGYVLIYDGPEDENFLPGWAGQVSLVEMVAGSDVLHSEALDCLKNGDMEDE